MSSKPLITVEQFGAMHFSDTEDYELVEGELIPLSSGTYRHNKIRDLLGHLLWGYFQRNPIGESVGENDCRVSEGKIRRPDLSVFLNERLRQIDLDKIPAPFPPDIAVEILSPSEGIMETRGKVHEYLSAGSAEVWLLDHANREIQVHTPGQIRVLDANALLETPVLPGFSAAVAQLVL
jgi:Uma2 family endonuclease